jgi:FMN phosphatase YigB (HAD superfamily)
MVGDDFAADVVGAKRIGMRAIWKSTRPIPDAVFPERPDATIASLTELPGVLEAWSRG